ncbi:MAG TPA: DUF1559 domain-containing protein [Pirellulaceae bacterium]|nr:DUF1559 domain-containing protein [Pirellulaceae bacterium]HMO93977.1 DUF1559 domain-containing protein [Pirellulaceae bacterium]HMP70835.1 DUF1559 domain-containing protein [Pirellulaceae bacterium]
MSQDYNSNPSSAPIPPVNHPVKPRLETSNSTLKIVLIVCGIMLMLLALAGFFLLFLLVPAIGGVRDAARRSAASNQARVLIISLHNYHGANNRFPNAAIRDQSGVPLHSWRTSLLPFIESAHILQRIDLAKPWNDPTNAAAINSFVYAFSSPRCPDSQETNKTAYVAVVGPDTVITTDGRRTFESIAKGTGLTGVLLEIPESNIAWAEPRDITIEQAIQYIQSFKGSGGLCVALADGSVMTIPPSTSAEDIRRLFNCSGDAPSFLVN